MWKKYKVLDDIKNFWHEGIETMISQELEAASLETGISVETKGILAGIAYSLINAGMIVMEMICENLNSDESI